VATPIDPPTGVPSATLSGWAESTLAGLTLRQKVGQMVMARVLGDFAPEGSEAWEETVALVDEQQIGGLIVSVGTPLDVAAKLNILQRRSGVPLLVAADLERGVGFRLNGAVYLPGATDLGGATDFPSLMALGAIGDPGLAYEMGRVTAEEARAVGIHLPFAPVLDVNNNPENPVINVRSIGEDPTLVADLGVCLVRGIQDHGAVATGKHFPGHGDTDVDSHLALPVIRVGRDRLDAVELLPFRRAMEAGMGAVMTAHIALPGLTEASDLPATLSRNVLTGILREELGFDGLVFTDAMNMSAVDGRFGSGEAAVRAVEAGADVILMPPNAETVARAVVQAVEEGRVLETRIDESVLRILRIKEGMSLHSERTVDLEAVHGVVGVPDHLAIAQEIAERSLTLLRNEGDLLPLAGTRSADVLSITYRRPSDLMAGSAFEARMRETYPRLRTAVLDADTPESEYEDLLERASESDLVVFSLYIPEVSTDDEVAGSEELIELVRGVGERGRPHVVVSFGNPYLLSEFPDVRSYMVAWGDASASQRAAAGALLGDVTVMGRSPIRIPPSVEVGDGILLLGPGVSATTDGAPRVLCP
jgi:beta-N-acetylhexosaminidase